MQQLYRYITIYNYIAPK